MVARVELSKYRKRAEEVALAGHVESYGGGVLQHSSLLVNLPPPLKLPNLEIRVSLNKPLLKPLISEGGTLMGEVDGPPSTSRFKFSSLQV